MEKIVPHMKSEVGKWASLLQPRHFSAGISRPHYGGMKVFTYTTRFNPFKRYEGAHYGGNQPCWYQKYLRTIPRLNDKTLGTKPIDTLPITFNPHTIPIQQYMKYQREWQLFQDMLEAKYKEYLNNSDQYTTPKKKFIPVDQPSSITQNHLKADKIELNPPKMVKSKLNIKGKELKALIKPISKERKAEIRKLKIDKVRKASAHVVDLSSLSPEQRERFKSLKKTPKIEPIKGYEPQKGLKHYGNGIYARNGKEALQILKTINIAKKEGIINKDETINPKIAENHPMVHKDVITESDLFDASLDNCFYYLGNSTQSITKLEFINQLPLSLADKINGSTEEYDHVNFRFRNNQLEIRTYRTAKGRATTTIMGA